MNPKSSNAAPHTSTAGTRAIGCVRSSGCSTVSASAPKKGFPRFGVRKPIVRVLPARNALAMAFGR